MQKGANAKSSGGKRRRNWSLPEATVQSIQSIRAQTDAGTDTEVIKRALKLYELAVKNQKAGVKVIFRDENGNDSAVIFL